MAFPKLAILGFLILATALEVFGDAIVRIGLGQPAIATRLPYFACGAVLLFGYGLSLNLAPIEFERVVGIYIATLFTMWQIVSFLPFRTVPSLPTLVGGALIICGGMVVASRLKSPSRRSRSSSTHSRTRSSSASMLTSPVTMGAMAASHAMPSAASSSSWARWVSVGC